jgi:hypothetical protein
LFFIQLCLYAVSNHVPADHLNPFQFNFNFYNAVSNLDKQTTKSNTNANFYNAVSNLDKQTTKSNTNANTNFINAVSNLVKADYI